MEFSGRVALITGGAQGIGFECGRILRAGGADVILVDVNEAGLLAAQKELEGLGKPVAIYTCNVADEEAVNQVIASQIGSDRILFGTDTYAAGAQRGRIEYALISEQDKENIFIHNAKKLFGL